MKGKDKAPKMSTQHGFTYYDYRISKPSSSPDYNQNNSSIVDQMSADLSVALDLKGRVKKVKPPVAPKPCVKSLPLVEEAPIPIAALSPPEQFRDPPITDSYIPVPEQFAERPLYRQIHPVPKTKTETPKHAPIPKPRHHSVSKTSSIESSSSNCSSIASSSDSIPSSPSLQRPKSRVRKQRASTNKENLKQFVEKHVKSGLTGSLPMPDEAATKSPYSDDWIKKKQYLSFQKQHVCRDVKFDGECNIILTTKFSVQMYDNNGVFKEKLYINRVNEPWGLHINHQTGNVLVTDHDDGCVKEFNALGIIVQEYGPIPTPCGVTVSNSGYVFVCSRSEGCVYVFDKRGDMITKLGKGILTAPTYIVLHGKSVLVSDDSSIVAFNITNDIEFVYGQRDGSDHPGCLCVDVKTGYVFSTSYYKDQIVALNKSMRRAIRIKDIKRPLTCTISPFGHLLIGEHNAKGMLFRMFRM